MALFGEKNQNQVDAAIGRVQSGNGSKDDYETANKAKTISGDTGRRAAHALEEDAKNNK